MHFNALDITIEGRDSAVWLIFSGPFHKEQIPQIREKFSVLLEDGNRVFVVDLENLTFIDDSVVQMFLQVLNVIKGKGGELKLIFKKETVWRAFSHFLNLISVYPDAASMKSGSFFATLRRRGELLSRKTGIRISRPIAIFLLIVLCGWFLSLVFIIHLQNRHIKEQQAELTNLTQWKQKSLIEINSLSERIRPLEQLGILRDTIAPEH